MSVQAVPPASLRVWDLPTRVFHWALMLCVVGCVVTVKVGGDLMAWHLRLGYAALALLIFRFVWGWVGARYARFSSFPPSVPAALAYLRGQAAPRPGHNPLGAFSVYALLLVLIAQATTGLFTSDDIMWDGPLRAAVSDSLSGALSTLHRANEGVLLALVALHVGAVVFYGKVKKHPLVKAMITGDQPAAAFPAAVPARDDAALRLAGFALMAAAAAVVAAIVLGA